MTALRRLAIEFACLLRRSIRKLVGEHTVHSQLSDRTVRGSSAVGAKVSVVIAERSPLTVPRLRNLSPAVRLLLWEELRQRGEASPRPARLALATKAVTIFAPARFIGLYDGRLAEDRNSPGRKSLGNGRHDLSF
jgi:hypothetical protein